MSGISTTETGDQKPSLGILVKGLAESELKMLSAVVNISRRRNSPLTLLDDNEQEQACVLVIDANSLDAINWVKNNKELVRNKPVIWIDSKKFKNKHINLQRPVMWSNLPIAISQAIDTFDAFQSNSSGGAQYESASTVEAHKKSDTCVLAVDDSQAVCDYVASSLASEGIKVTTANSGEVALEIMSEKTDFSCVLMDVLMPGMDGYEACRIIKNKHKDIPVLMLTGKTSPFDRIRAKMAGCDAYLTKPINQQDLIKKLKDYM